MAREKIREPSIEKRIQRAERDKISAEIEKKQKDPVGYINDLIKNFKLGEGLKHLSDKEKKEYFRDLPEKPTTLPSQEANWCLSRIMLRSIKRVPPQGQSYQRDIAKWETKSDNQFKVKDPEELKQKKAHEILNAVGIDASKNWVIDLPTGSLYSLVERENGLDYIAKLNGQYYMAEAKSSNAPTLKTFRKKSVPYLLDFIVRLADYYKTISNKIKPVGIVTNDAERKAVISSAKNSGIIFKNEIKVVEDSIKTVAEFVAGTRPVRILSGNVVEKVLYAISEMDNDFNPKWFLFEKATRQNASTESIKEQSNYFNY